MSDRTALRPETIAVSAGRPPRTPDAPTSTPVTFASAFVAGGEIEYARYGNPSWTALEDALGALEGGTCVSFSSGMAAVSAVLSIVPHGGAVAVPRGASGAEQLVGYITTSTPVSEHALKQALAGKLAEVMVPAHITAL